MAVENSRRSLALGSARWGGGKDAVHGTLLRGQRPLGRRGGVEEDLDQRERRGERLPLAGGGEEVKVEQRGSARSLAVSGARGSPGSRQRLSLSIIQFTRPRPHIFFNSSETTRGIRHLGVFGPFSAAAATRASGPTPGLTPPPTHTHPGYTPTTTPPPQPPPRHLSSG